MNNRLTHIDMLVKETPWVFYGIFFELDFLFEPPQDLLIVVNHGSMGFLIKNPWTKPSIWGTWIWNSQTLTLLEHGGYDHRKNLEPESEFHKQTHGYSLMILHWQSRNWRCTKEYRTETACVEEGIVELPWAADVFCFCQPPVAAKIQSP